MKLQHLLAFVEKKNSAMKHKECVFFLLFSRMQREPCGVPFKPKARIGIMKIKSMGGVGFFLPSLIYSIFASTQCAA